MSLPFRNFPDKKKLRYFNDNPTQFFINIFIKTIIYLLIPAEVLSEDSILKWYKDAHSSKGKMHFLQQMKKFVEWLQNAEEGNIFEYFSNFAHQLEQFFR